METLTVLEFDTAEGAQKALHVVEDLSKRQLINLHDAAIVTWPEGKKKPKTEQLHNLAGVGALSGAFWGMLFGLIFLFPYLVWLLERQWAHLQVPCLMWVSMRIS